MSSPPTSGRRARQLSSDARAGAWATGKARRAQRRFVRRNWRLLLGAFSVIVVPSIAVLPFLPGQFQRGLVVGVAVSSATAIVGYFVLQATGTGPTMMGATAEQWTSSELRPLRKQGWRHVNHLALRQWDIDHVVVGPGGAWAVETKWSSRPWKTEPPEERVLVAVEQARRNARDLTLWHPFKSATGAAVKPVVILWGTTEDLEGPDAPAEREIAGVSVLLGLDGASQWRSRVERERGALTSAQVDAAWQALDAQARSRDQRELAAEPIPPSIARMYARGSAVVAAALAGFLLAIYSLSWIGVWVLWICVVAAAVVAGILCRRVPGLQWPALGWLFGWSVSLLLVAGAVVREIS